MRPIIRLEDETLLDSNASDGLLGAVSEKKDITIKILNVQLIKRESRYTTFFEPPMRDITLYDEDWKEASA
jgi:hypothetical protein